ncbi:Rnase Y domain-containing protein, partial [Staphylococcus aureus]|uniref:Rnase Y domain-containing protein n=1 Tax=Staphylococcus aureus TaxID=1280 RepID=UPI001151AB97
MALPLSYCGLILCRNLLLQKQSQARQTAEDIVNQAHKEADNIKKEKLLEAKEENQILREQTEAELRVRFPQREHHNRH